MRKLLLIGLPIFLEPQSNLQLMLGLMIAFFAQSMVAYFMPFRETHENVLALMAQVNIFFVILSSVTLRVLDDGHPLTEKLDILLTISAVSTVLYACYDPDIIQQLKEVYKQRKTKEVDRNENVPSVLSVPSVPSVLSVPSGQGQVVAGGSGDGGAHVIAGSGGDSGAQVVAGGGGDGGAQVVAGGGGVCMRLRSSSPPRIVLWV